MTRLTFTLESPPSLAVDLRVTTAFWEDKGTLCFQVKVQKVCIARREDINMINGTRLLDVSRMSRGRCDGILKAQKHWIVVKVGAMNLKGVWISYEHAIALAKRESIVDALFSLFVVYIKSLLYHPSNYCKTALVLAAAERKREENKQREKDLQKRGNPRPRGAATHVDSATDLL
jgi:protein SOK2